MSPMSHASEVLLAGGKIFSGGDGKGNASSGTLNKTHHQQFRADELRQNTVQRNQSNVT